MKLGSGMPLYRACGEEGSSVVNKELVSKNKQYDQAVVSPGACPVALCSGLPQVCSSLWMWQHLSCLRNKAKYRQWETTASLQRCKTQNLKGLRTHLTAGWCSQRWPMGRRGTARGRCSCGQPGCWGGGDTGSCWDDHAATATCSSLLCALSRGFLSEKGENSTGMWFR